MPDNNLVQVCVGRYEINLNKYIETGQDKYLLILKAIGKYIRAVSGCRISFSLEERTIYYGSSSIYDLVLAYFLILAQAHFLHLIRYGRSNVSISFISLQS